MSKDEKVSLVAIPLILLMGWGFAFLGSDGAYRLDWTHPFHVAVILAFSIQWVAFVPAFLLRSERFFDLAGGATFMLATVVAVLLSPEIDARSWLLLAMICIWALRLSLFLFRRVHRVGKDERFDALKHSFARFLGAWTLQGLWVTFTLSAALAAIASTTRKPLGWIAILGVVVWIVGFAIEAVSDHQKKRFKENDSNQGKFIQTGLWSLSRHPNYFGEIVLWIGIAIVAIPALEGWQWGTLSSPLFVTILLMKVSGIPLLERRANEKWGGQEDYEAYKSSTPILFPRLLR